MKKEYIAPKTKLALFQMHDIIATGASGEDSEVPVDETDSPVEPKSPWIR